MDYYYNFGKKLKVTDYKGLWRPKTRSIGTMKKAELVSDISKFVKAWEKVTDRSEDMPVSRLKKETITNLRTILNEYYSIGNKQLAEEWL